MHAPAAEGHYFSLAGFSVQACSRAISSNSGALKPSGWMGHAKVPRASVATYFSISRLPLRTETSFAPASPASVAAKSASESFWDPIQTSLGRRWFARMNPAASIFARSNAGREISDAVYVVAARAEGPSTAAGSMPSRIWSISAADNTP